MLMNINSILLYIIKIDQCYFNLLMITYCSVCKKSLHKKVFPFSRRHFKKICNYFVGDNYYFKLLVKKIKHLFINDILVHIITDINFLKKKKNKSIFNDDSTQYNYSMNDYIDNPCRLTAEYWVSEISYSIKKIQLEKKLDVFFESIDIYEKYNNYYDQIFSSYQASCNSFHYGLILQFIEDHEKLLQKCSSLMY